MGKDTKIPWATHTFNPWWGCAKLPYRRGCDRCYAESFSKRAGKNVWGQDAERWIASENVWKNPRRWNAEAAESGARPMVFCMSMGDFLEDRPELVQPRNRAIRIIKETQYLDWLILTKRIKNSHFLPWKPGLFPSNVRIGITVENQEVWDEDVQYLQDLECRNFVSVEPMLGPIALGCPGIDWVICGAESAPGKRLGRPINLDWVRSLRDQCVRAGVPFFYKQGPVDGRLVELPKLDGRVWAELPEGG